MEKDFKGQSNEISKVLKQIEDQMVGITNEKLNKEIKSVMEEFKKITTNETLSIVLLGDTCSGKTQLINSLLESFDDKNYNDLLVTDCNENTFYTLNIENSINSKITSKFCGEKTKIHSTLKNLKNYLEELDEIGFKKIQDEKKLDTNQTTDIESIFMENDSSAQTKVLNIQLPNLDKNLRIASPFTAKKNINKDIETSNYIKQ